MCCWRHPLNRDAFDTATADAFIKAASERTAKRRARKFDRKGHSRVYHQASLIASKRLFGARANQPSPAILAAAIFRHQGLSERRISKEAAKQIVVEFAAGIPPLAAPAVAPEKPRKPIAQVTQVATPSVDFYWSPEWRRVRYVALRASRGVCELCGTGPAPGAPLHVDHIKPRSRFPELELDVTNLQVLCADCNLGKSNIDEIDWRRKQA